MSDPQNNTQQTQPKGEWPFEMIVDKPNDPLDIEGTSPFDRFKQERPDGVEFWSARDLMPLLGYASWQNFQTPIDRAMSTARNQGYDLSDLFMRSHEKTAGRPREDVKMVRYAAYLVAMNGDPNMAKVSEAQSYFAVQTRVAEVQQTKQLTIPQTMSEALRMAAEQWEQREIAEARAKEAEEIVEAVESNRGINCRKFHKHHFPDVPEREFFNLLYSSGLLIDQRRTRWHKKKQQWVDGYQHMHPTYKGKPYFILDGVVRDGRRREHTYVRPGKPELELRNLLIRKGLPAADIKEIEA